MLSACNTLTYTTAIVMASAEATDQLLDSAAVFARSAFNSLQVEFGQLGAIGITTGLLVALTLVLVCCCRCMLRQLLRTFCPCCTRRDPRHAAPPPPGPPRPLPPQGLHPPAGPPPGPTLPLCPKVVS